MDYQLTKVGRKTLWQRLLLSVLTLFFFPLHAQQPEQPTTIPLEANQSVAVNQRQRINLHFLLFKKVQQQIIVLRQKIKVQPMLQVMQQHRLQQINRYQILIRAGPIYRI